MKMTFMLCGSVVDYATGLGPEGAGLIAGRLVAEAEEFGICQNHHLRRGTCGPHNRWRVLGL